MKVTEQKISDCVRGDDLSFTTGDVVFTPGAGTTAIPPGKWDGSFIWKLADGKEVLRIDPDGSVFIKGEKSAYNKDLYDAFNSWVTAATS